MLRKGHVTTLLHLGSSPSLFLCWHSLPVCILTVISQPKERHHGNRTLTEITSDFWGTTGPCIYYESGKEYHSNIREPSDRQWLWAGFTWSAVLSRTELCLGCKNNAMTMVNPPLHEGWILRVYLHFFLTRQAIWLFFFSLPMAVVAYCNPITCGHSLTYACCITMM